MTLDECRDIWVVDSGNASLADVGVSAYSFDDSVGHSGHKLGYARIFPGDHHIFRCLLELHRRTVAKWYHAVYPLDHSDSVSAAHTPPWEVSMDVDRADRARCHLTWVFDAQRTLTWFFLVPGPSTPPLGTFTI